MQFPRIPMTVALVINTAILVFLLTQPVTSKRRHGHNKKQRTNTNATNELSQSKGTKRYKCSIKLKYGCSCSKTQGFLAISCYNAQLQKVPTFEMSSHIVRTLNLENNRISDIQLGDFYGWKIERLLLGNNTLSQLNVLSFWGLEYYLEILNISSNRFYTIPTASLRLLRHLRTLSFSHNYIKHLTSYGFSSLDKLEVLALDHNPIAEIDNHAFAGTNLYLLLLDKLALPNGLESIPTGDLGTLKGLSVAKNKLGWIPDQWFSNLTSLRYLIMDSNNLSELDPQVFKEVAISLRTLQLNGNRFRNVPKEAICVLINLEILELSRNRIKKLRGRSFNCSRNLQELDLSKNLISEMSNAAFHGLYSIHKIDLRKNQLVTLDDRMFFWDNLKDKQIYLGGNPWLCNCLVKWLKIHYRRKSKMMVLFPDVMRMRCQRPEFLEWKPLVRVALRDLTCDHDYYYYYYKEDDDAKEDDLSLLENGDEVET